LDWSKRKKKNGEVCGVLMGSISCSDLKGKEKLIKFKREGKEG
jgi:hypothetical protein